MEIGETASPSRRGGADAEEGKSAGGGKRRPRPGEIDVYKTARLYAMRGEFSPQRKNNGGRGNLVVVFVVDSSGSMAAGRQISNVKKIIGGTVAKNRGGIIKFAGVALSGDGARVFFPPGTDAGRLISSLAELKTGGRTNMSAGISLAGEVLRGAKNKRSGGAEVYVFTDGRINFCESGGDPFEESVRKFKAVIGKSARTTVVDTESGFVKIGAAAKFSEAIGANYLNAREIRE